MLLESISKNFIVSEIELIYKSKSKASDRPHINSAKDAFELFLKVWNPNKIELVEEFKVLFLNQANRVLAFCSFSTGGITGTIADPRLVFSAALKIGASALITAHNHPSGNLKPSRSDDESAPKLKEAGRFLDIKLLDNLIISSEGYFSFADEGVL